ncbi:MAG: 3-phosphoshikimate 1-carboxyvinyltransferase [Candidatus Theseobacter exili]|nr:3-phosphoshikimate 1-carboxyvinyltransferase [Candidatus Theseobacter exili]
MKTMKTIEIQPVQSINAVVNVPGSKSLTNRALPVAALADGISEIRNPLFSEDTELMANALEKIGVQIERREDVFIVHGRGGSFRPFSKPLFTGNSGTTMRFLTPLLAMGTGKYILEGTERMHLRPIGDLVKALEDVGGNICFLQKNGFPPLLIDAKGIKGGTARLRGSISSQFLTAVLLSSPYALGDTFINIQGDLVSRPYVDLTLKIMSDFGVGTENDNYKRFFVKSGQVYNSQTYIIEGDASSATYFFAAAAITGGRVRVRNLLPDSVQGDIKFVDLLKEMGSKVSYGSNWIEVQGASLIGIEADLNDMPDTAQTLAVVALFAKGKTVIKNVANLRVKETDRLYALKTELRKLGAGVKQVDDGMEITPSALKPARICTYNDHRMAMSFAVAGLVNAGIVIEDPDCVAKSFPDFWKEFGKMY